MESRAKLFGHPIHQMLIVFPLAAFILSFLGGGLALFTGWLGGELVDRLGVGVDEGAHVDAPSSLSARRVRG
jgi:uncharacterized membrane protein